MTGQAATNTEPRAPLTRERVLRAAVELADRDGLKALTMRNLAAELGVEAMSLYYHVANKEALLDGVVEMVVDEINEAVADIDATADATNWKQVIRRRILVAREILLRHPWAPTVMDTRTTISPVVARYHDRLVGLFRQGGFSYDLAHHSLHVLGSRALGFTQELFNPADGGGDDGGDAAAMLEQMAGEFPHLVAMIAEASHGDPASTLGWCDDQYEFEFALDIILDGLERARDT